MMKIFLLEFDTKPNRTRRLQYCETLAGVAIMAENAGLPLHSVTEINRDECAAFTVGGVAFGLHNIH